MAFAKIRDEGKTVYVSLSRLCWAEVLDRPPFPIVLVFEERTYTFGRFASQKDAEREVERLLSS